VTEAAANPSRGWFITFEGPDGSGKTLQAQRLHDAAVRAGVATLLAREPGGTPLGERIREVLLHGADLRIDERADALLFSAARAQHVSEVITPALAEGRLVICARFLDSTIAYQGYGRGLPVGELAALQRFATARLRPDLTILLDVPAEVGLARKTDDEQLRFEAAFDIAFHRRVRDGYLALAAAEPARFAVVDAGRGADAVAVDVARALERLPDLAARLAGGPTDEGTGER
jgi:dTMP kinase